MKQLAVSGVYTFFKVESADDVDKFEIGLAQAKSESEFGFFKGLGMVDYSKTFKTWLREFPRPIFIVAVKENSIVAWVYITDWKSFSKDGDSIYVLRAIETLERFRSRKLGFRLLVLGLNQTAGFMITKPLNEKSEAFFRKAGFMAENEFKRCPIDLSRHHGYLMLPPFKKYGILEHSHRYFSEPIGK
ncbi:MAG: GNAT family N-acetyltransferase [Methanomassiliicoccales archaeon]|nr:MAG: GNAT family N-acetyltransferase [Methanomassiliicoccales archaeon]